MESSGLFNNVVRVKEKSGDGSLIQNDCDMIDEKPNLKHLRSLSISLKDAIEALRKYDKNREAELENEMKTVFEYEEQNMDLSVVKKIDDDFQYHLQNVQNNDGYETQNIAKIETSEEEKQEFFGEVAEKLNLNIYCETVKQNRKRRTNEHNLEPNIDMQHNGASSHACNICRKNFATKGYIKIHINSVHKNIKHPCDICDKQFTSKAYLNTHIDFVHNKVTHTCYMCGKKFSERGHLRKHIEWMHIGTNNACDICGKCFAHKRGLQLHINATHSGIRYACDSCEKTFAHKRSIQLHVDTMHSGIRYTCNVCEKKFAQKGYLKTHIDSVHNGITHLCDVCGKTFNKKGSLKIHSYKEHNSRITT